MDKDETIKNIETSEALEVAPLVATAVPVLPTKDARISGNAFPKRDFSANKFGARRGSRKGGPREDRVKEFDQKILTIRRVTRVASGGRRFSFSVAIVIGNRKGSVGVGTGKAGDTTIAIDKAARNAKKNLIKINRTKNLSIAHQLEAKYSSAEIMIMPAKGRGLISGSAVRDVLDLGGVNDVVTKILSGSKNRLNIARATIKALQQLAPEKVTVRKEAQI